MILQIYGQTASQDLMNDASRIARLRGPRSINPGDLPDLVTFADINNPGSVVEVDPYNLQATLGPDISWNEITLEITNDWLTTGIKRKLPWIDAYYDKMLDGRRFHYFDKTKSLANDLSTADLHH
jgi:hypothetical protein